MRLFALISLILLGLTAWQVPLLREAESHSGWERPLYDEDPRVRAEHATEQGMLGAAYAAYDEILQADPDDAEALRGKIGAVLKLSGAAYNQANLDELVRAGVKDYLANRERIDPDGSFLRETMREWAILRMQYPMTTSIGWYAQVSAALYLAGQGYRDGFRQLRHYADSGPFYGELFRYSMRYHPPFRALRPLLVRYLEEGDLNARVAAGATLLEYHTLFGEGADLWERHEETIRKAIHEAVKKINPVLQEGEEFHRASTAILGLARLGGERDIALLRKIRSVDVPHQAMALQIARLWTGIDDIQYYDPDSSWYDRLSLTDKELYYVHAGHRFVTLPDGDLKEFYRRIVRDGVVSRESVRIQIYSIRILAAHAPDDINLLNVAKGGGFPSLIAATLLDGDTAPYLLPGIVSPEPNFSALAAISILPVQE